MKGDLKTVSEVCQLTGLKRKQLHDYDRQGILKPCDYENAAGYKLYDDEAIKKLKVIANLRDAGLPQKDIGRFINGPISDRPGILEHHIQALHLHMSLTSHQLALSEELLKKYEKEGKEK